MVEINITYTGDLHCRAEHGPSGTVLLTDAPVDNQGKGEFFSPTDLMAASLGTCYMTIMAICAKNHGVNMDGAKARVEKHMSSELPRRVAKVVVYIELPSGIPHDKRQMLENASRNCPSSKSVHPDMELDISFNYPD